MLEVDRENIFAFNANKLSCCDPVALYNEVNYFPDQFIHARASGQEDDMFLVDFWIFCVTCFSKVLIR